jgi:hypothetical protein
MEPDRVSQTLGGAGLPAPPFVPVIVPEKGVGLFESLRDREPGPKLGGEIC